MIEHLRLISLEITYVALPMDEKTCSGEDPIRSGLFMIYLTTMVVTGIMGL
jgi:hypothetical protein